MQDPLEYASPVKRVQALARRSEDLSIFYLGEGLLGAFKPPEMRCKAPYREMGEELWAALEYELHQLLCDSALRKPKDWTAELIEGDTRNLIVALLTLLVAKYEMTLAVAVPATALLVKKRLAGLCAKRPNRPKRSVRAIFSYMKRHWHAKIQAAYWAPTKGISRDKHSRRTRKRR